MLVEEIPRRIMRDRGLIAPRSFLDRTVFTVFFHETFGLSDGDPSDRDPHDHRGPHDLLPST